MALETLSSNELLNFIIYDTISAPPPAYTCNNETLQPSFLPETCLKPPEFGTGGGASDSSSSMAKMSSPLGPEEAANGLRSSAVQGRKKRRRRPKVCRNKEEAETQRMTHIVVERNRRKQMNDYLAVLRSLMPESYVQRGDQASIVGGAIEYVKELEHLLQSLEAQKLQLLQREERAPPTAATVNAATAAAANNPDFLTSALAQFFDNPQLYTWSHQCPNKYTTKCKAEVAEIEVTLIETHANLKILTRRSVNTHLSKLVAGFQTLCLTILHLNVTTFDPLVLYSVSAKVEEGCQLASADDIAGAVHHMLRIIEEESDPLC
ncbi:hypothetical protein U1Q18_021539 [Sarracenia purpurea var. burkii]